MRLIATLLWIASTSESLLQRSMLLPVQIAQEYDIIFSEVKLVLSGSVEK